MTTHNTNPLDVSQLVTVVVVAAVILIVTFLGLEKANAFLKLKEEQLRNTAIDQCATASR